MEMLFVVFMFMLIVVILMAVGVILGRKPIAGSCGGMSAIGMESACDVCGGDKAICDTEVEKAAQQTKSNLGYDAANR